MGAADTAARRAADCGVRLLHAPPRSGRMAGFAGFAASVSCPVLSCLLTDPHSACVDPGRDGELTFRASYRVTYYY